MLIRTRQKGYKGKEAVLVTRISENRVQFSQHGHALDKKQLSKRLSITAMAIGGDSYLGHEIKGLKTVKNQQQSKNHTNKKRYR